MQTLASLRDRARTLPERHGRRTLVILAVILAVGFALRLDRVIHPIGQPGDDAAAYYALSKALYEHGSYGDANFQNSSDWSPGAPLLYAGTYYATLGPRQGAARGLNALLGVGAILVVYLIGCRLSCRPAGLVAAAGVAIYPSFIHTTGALLSEAPAIFTLPAAVLAFLWADEQRKPAAWLLPGFLLGLTALIRPEYLLVGAALALLALIREWRRAGWRRGAGITALLVLALLIPVVPWTVRNYDVLGRFVPLSTGGGKALYVGSYLPADGDYQRVKAVLVKRFYGRDLEPGSPALDRVNPVPLFDRIAARYPDLPRDSALGRVGKKNLWHYLGDDPVGYAGMTVRKIGRMWTTGVGPAMDTTIGRIAQRLLLLGALAGFAVLAWRRRWEGIAMAIPIVTVTGIGALTLASNRRGEILMTLVIPLAAVAATRGVAWLRGRRRTGEGPAPAAHGGAQA